ncbi:MAG: putative rane protein [Herbinix sp.]|jgi:hypothetical protein|nr:putative rane protein [Herbinix sp.]
MNQKIGAYASAVNLLAVTCFAISMLISSDFISYLSSILIAFSFVVMTCAFVYFSGEGAKVSGFCAMAFGIMYALCNSIVYFIQLSTVRNSPLTDQAADLLAFERFGMIFNLDMLGYCLMSISTIFIGITLEVRTRADRWLKWLFIVHGVFAVSCFMIPILGLFGSASQGSEIIGVLILEFWCLYFAPIGFLSFLHFARK